jgi:hypothetical protein
MLSMDSLSTHEGFLCSSPPGSPPPHRTERLDVRRLRDPARSVACASSSLMPTTPLPKAGKANESTARPSPEKSGFIGVVGATLTAARAMACFCERLLTRHSRYLMRSGAVVSLFVYLSLAVRGNHDDSINSFQTTRKNIGQHEGGSRHGAVRNVVGIGVAQAPRI